MQLRKAILSIILLILPVVLFAATHTIKGKVVDEQGVAVSYASVYLKQNPEIGTISNLEGFFSLDLPSVSGDLVVSFIGYGIETTPINKKTIGKELLIVLKDQPILLDEALVLYKKPQKKMTKKQKKAILNEVLSQMQQDIPARPCKYKIVSDYIIYHKDKVMAYEEVLGDLVELTGTTTKNKFKTDSVQLKASVCRRYRNDIASSRYNDFTQTKIKDKHKKYAQLVDSVTTTHRLMWGSSPQWLFKENMSKTDAWTFTESGNDLVLNFKQKRNYLGILKYEINIHYVVDQYSYHLSKVSQDIVVYVNIPFGYKLDKEELAFLNILSLDSEMFAKYRIKKADVRVKRNVFFNYSRGRSYVTEKSVDMDVKIAERKDKNDVNVHCTSAFNVLDAVDNAQPFSNSQLNSNVRFEWIDSVPSK